MSASWDGVNMNSMNSGAALGEGASDGVDDDLGHKTLVENSGDKSNSTGGVRVLDEAKVLSGETNTEPITNELKWKEFGYLDNGNYGSKHRVVDLMSRDDGWGMMNLVGRVLGGNFGMDTEVDVENTSQNSPGINLVVDLNPWQDMIGELTSTYEVPVLYGNQDTVPDGKSESVEVGYSEADVLMTEGYGKQESITNKLLPIGKSESKEVSNVEDDVLMAEGYGNQDSITNELVPDGKLEIKEVNNAEADVLMADGNQKQDSIANELVDGKLEFKSVDNVDADILMTDSQREQFVIEENTKYCVSGLVWGKVRSHPWWPGQMFSPSDASNKAVQYFNLKKDKSYLIAYFGDNTFAWNEASKIKPFHMNFPEMEKQSNTEGFLHAVSCSLDEVSRRVEFGLSCPCLPEEVRNKVRTKVVVNAGILAECSRRDGGGESLYTAASFVTGELVKFLESLAENPGCKTDRLQFTVMKAQLLGFNGWKGRYHLPLFKEFGELVEDDTLSTAKGQRNASEEVMGVNETPSKKRKSTARNVSSRKRKIPPCETLPDKKEKELSVLMSTSCPSPTLQNDENKTVKRRRRKKGQKNLMSLNSPSLRNGEYKTVKRRGRKKGQKNLMSSQTKSLTPDEILSKLGGQKPFARS